MSYAVAKKNMASTTYSGGRSSNSKYIVQKASGSNAYGTATSAINASKHSNIQQFNHKYDAKVNSHLLDHGYGAAPQTSTYDDANTSRFSNDSGNFKGYTNSTDGSITKYYKVCYSLFVYFPCRLYRTNILMYRIHTGAQLFPIYRIFK